LQLDLSVIIITKNEQGSLPRCLRSLPEGAEIVVLDCGSTDATAKLAKDAGAMIHHRPFDDYASQKNAAAALATRKWVLSVDADEELSPELRDAVVDIVKADNEKAFRIKRRLVFLGRKMRFGKTVDEPLRLWPRGMGQFHGEIHEVVQTPLAIGTIRLGELCHFSYATLDDYFSRFNRYTSLVAKRHAASGRKAPPKIIQALRPAVEFMVRYVFRLGFLDGYPGYAYALVSSLYTFIKYAKLRELSESRHS